MLAAVTVSVRYPVHAQSIGFTTSIEIEPLLPGPYEDISLRVTSTQTDLNRAVISWYLNGELRISDIGKTSVRLRTGPVGNNQRIRVVIDKAEGGQITRSITVRPTAVDIIWKAHAYTPPFYKGKALSPSAGLVVLTAMPELKDQRGNKLDPRELVYTWSERGVVLGNASGFGKQSIVLSNGTVAQRPLVVKVLVSSFDNTIQAQATTRVPVQGTAIVFYEKHPLEGIRYGSAIVDTFDLLEDEITVRAEPFYFSLDDIASGLIRYRWKINGGDISVPLKEQGTEMVFRKEGIRSGLTRISFKAENFNIPFRVLQEAFSEFTINLGR